MKSPAEIGKSLARQWRQPGVRRERLLGPGAWPLELTIGRPSAGLVAANPQVVRGHVDGWRRVRIGEVEWEPVGYRAVLEPIQMPMTWRLRNPSEWVAATGDPDVAREYRMLEALVEQTDGAFHAMLVSQRGLWLRKAASEVITAARLAARLSPGCAQGRPLRLLAEQGVDTKFFERNAALLTRLMDERFEGEVSAQGLATFLDAFDENSHWVLLAPLSPGLLPFKRLRLTTAELAEVDLPCSRVLVVENEQCIHLLPDLPDTIAVLGAGLDLRWLASVHLADKSLGYWGDMDTWGLLMLARARQRQPDIQALLMERSLFDRYESTRAVVEPVKAQGAVPEGLEPDEASFYRYLLTRERGRLEQEYLSKDDVEKNLIAWAMKTPRSPA